MGCGHGKVLAAPEALPSPYQTHLPPPGPSPTPAPLQDSSSAATSFLCVSDVYWWLPSHLNVFRYLPCETIQAPAVPLPPTPESTVCLFPWNVFLGRHSPHSLSLLSPLLCICHHLNPLLANSTPSALSKDLARPLFPLIIHCLCVYFISNATGH